MGRTKLYIWLGSRYLNYIKRLFLSVINQSYVGFFLSLREQKLILLNLTTTDS